MPASAATRLRPRRALLLLLLVLLATLYAFFQAPHPQPEVQRSGWAWWAYPIERNASLRFPALPGILRAVSFADEEHGWAVGDGGVILASKDGGTSWQAQAVALRWIWQLCNFYPLKFN